MVYQLEIKPSVAGVVYSPGGHGWQFYAEPMLYVGFTDNQAAQTAVRSVLSFVLPPLGVNALLVRACLHLRPILNEPPDRDKLLCLRETPSGALTPWSLEQEQRQAVLADHRLKNETGFDLAFPLTDTVTAWQRGAPNNGVILDFDHLVLGLVGFDNGREHGPRLMLEYVIPAKDAAAVSLEVVAEGAAISPELPCREILVRNVGPDPAWITPLYRFDKEPLVDPIGLPLGVLDPGEYMVVEPKLPAKALAIRVETAPTPALVLITPLSPKNWDEEGRD